jgi:predicted TIM-barrel fold metal-dependent hydrolase
MPIGLSTGHIIELVEVLFPDAAERDTLFWNTPQRLFGFAA